MSDNVPADGIRAMVPPEQMAPMMEMAFKMQFQDYKKLKSGSVSAGEVKGFEMEFTGSMSGTSMHVLQRIFAKEKQMFMLLGMTDAASWEKHGEAVRKSVESLTFGAKPAAEKKDEAENVKDKAEEVKEEEK